MAWGREVYAEKQEVTAADLNNGEQGVEEAKAAAATAQTIAVEAKTEAGEGKAKAEAEKTAREAAQQVLEKHEVTAAYELALSDAGKVVELNKASEGTITIPKHSSVAFATDTVIELCQIGAGKVAVAAASGVTLHSTGGSVKTRTQYSSISLRQRAENEWILSGDLE